MSEINSWGISKQYLAAHYYLSEERPISISEAQRAQLGALHLHVSYGPYQDSIEIPDLQNCTVSEKKKRTSEWKKLGAISRITAMKKFIDLISSLFPNWYRFHKLFNEFEQEWTNMPESTPVRKTESPKIEVQKTIKRKPMTDYREGTPNAFKKIIEMKRSRNQKLRNRNGIRNYTPDLILKKEAEKKIETSQLPRITNSFRQYEERNDEFLRDFLEDLQSYKGGNIRNTSATKLPKHLERPEMNGIKYRTPDINFENELKNYRKKLLVQEFSKLTEKSEPNTFQQKKIVPNLIEKISQMKSTLNQIEADYLKLDSKVMKFNEKSLIE